MAPSCWTTSSFERCVHQFEHRDLFVMLLAWAWGSVFYHLTPWVSATHQSGMISTASPQPRLEVLSNGGHAQRLGANACTWGPVFESSTHGYDTADYLVVDRRLGRNEDLARFCKAARAVRRPRIIRRRLQSRRTDFWAFKDLLLKGKGFGLA